MSTTTRELYTSLAAKESHLKEVNKRLSSALSDDTIRALLKTKNELIADIQTLEIRIQKANAQAKSFERSLNESFEL